MRLSWWGNRACHREDLLENGLLGFEDKGPNVHNNPLLAHRTMAVNTIDHEDKRIINPNGESREVMVLTYQVEEESYPGQENDGMVACLEGNNNPHPKPLIIQYNSAPKPRVLFII
ncbi:hypothetical protein CR513_47586, partial [Mucuna pruriens]